MQNCGVHSCANPGAPAANELVVVGIAVSTTSANGLGTLNAAAQDARRSTVEPAPVDAQVELAHDG
eukprot:1189328-Pyramimonas_sp.AAC.1